MESNTTQPARSTRKRPQQFLMLLVVAGVVIVGALVWSQFKQDARTSGTNQNANSKKNTNSRLNTNSVQNENTNQTSAVNQEDALATYGFWIPGLENTAPTSTSEGETYTYDFGDGNAISIMPTEFSSVITASLGNSTEESLTIDGYPATQITGASAKDGSTVVYLLIDVRQQVYFIRGTEAFRTSVIQSMQLP